MNKELDFEDELFYMLGKHVVIRIGNKIVMNGILKEVKQDFCNIVFSTSAGDFKALYPFLYNVKDGTHSFSYKVKDLMINDEGKRMVQAIVDEDDENISPLLNQTVTIKLDEHPTA